MNDLVYLDNASTSFPKPDEVLDFMCGFYRNKGVSSARACSGLAAEVKEMYANTRKRLTKFFNAGTDFNRLVFTYNATDSLNLAIQGLLNKGDHIVTTMLEHHASLRPISHMIADGLIEADFVPFGEHGEIDPDDIKKSIKKNTRLVSVVHGSNVIGTIQPIKEIGRICKERGIIFLADISQTAGVVPVDMQDMNIDVIAFTGHKSLYGPTGIGGLYVGKGVEIRQTRYGGTGIRSEEKYHLKEYPHRLEAGTINLMGVAGLYAGLEYIEKRGMENIHKHEMRLFARLRDGLRKIPNVKLYCADCENHLPVLSINIGNIHSNDIATILSDRYNISTRPGLHCAPKLHEQLGTNNTGTVRFSIGAFNTDAEIDYTIMAVSEIALKATLNNICEKEPVRTAR